MDGGNGRLRRMVGRHALDGQAQDRAGLFVGLGLRAGLGVADDCRGLVGDLVFERVEQLGLRLVGRHPGHALETAADLLLGRVQIALAAVELALLGRHLMLARVERLHASVEQLLALGQATLGRAHLAQALLVLCLSLLLEAQGLVLRFDDGLAAQRLGLPFGVGHQGFGLLRRTLGGRVGQKPGDDEAEGDADDGADDQPNDLGHALPLSFRVVDGTVLRVCGRKKSRQSRA